MARWYVSRGWTIVARNFRSTRGELDVVAFSRGTLVVCEVKTRATVSMGHPFESITADKQHRVRRAAADFLEWLRVDDPSLHAMIRRVRFDAASVVGTDIEVLADAF